MVKKNVEEIKLSKYQKASHKVLYYMLMDEKYINLYKNTLGYFTTNIDLSNYKYSITTNSNGVMTYQLGVTLPNGTYYKSPGSNQ